MHECWRRHWAKDLSTQHGTCHSLCQSLIGAGSSFSTPLSSMPLHFQLLLTDLKAQLRWLVEDWVLVAGLPQTGMQIVQTRISALLEGDVFHLRKERLLFLGKGFFHLRKGYPSRGERRGCPTRAEDAPVEERASFTLREDINLRNGFSFLLSSTGTLEMPKELTGPVFLTSHHRTENIWTMHSPDRDGFLQDVHKTIWAFLTYI